MPTKAAPIEWIFRKVFHREMTPQERGILLADSVKTRSSIGIPSKPVLKRAEISTNVISGEKTSGFAESQVSRAVMGLREMLLRGEFRPGERIAEIPLSSRLNVSRTPLRLAFEKLAIEGLIKALPHSGFAASEFSIEDIWEAIETRSILEGAAARLAAERVSNPAQLGPLRKINCAVEESLQLGIEVFTDRYLDLNKAFHSAILNLADNQALRRATEQVWVLPFVSPSAIVLLYKNIPALKGILPIAQEHHRAIFEAIEHKEGGRAEGLAREHALVSRRNLELAMGNRKIFETIPGAPLLKFQNSGRRSYV